MQHVGDVGIDDRLMSWLRRENGRREARDRSLPRCNAPLRPRFQTLVATMQQRRGHWLAYLLLTSVVNHGHLRHGTVKFLQELGSMRKTSLGAAAFLAILSAPAVGADAPGRVVKSVAPPVASAACKETAALPTDIFGFTTGSDVNDLGALSGALEYNGNYGTRFGKLYGHLGKAQVSYSPFPCFEIGPSIIGVTSNARFNTFGLDTRQIGGSVEMKYKLLGRATHGIGLTFTTEPGAFSRKYTSGFVDVFGNPVQPSGSVYSNLARILMDAELVKDRLYGALNIEYGALWDNPVSQSPGFGFPTPGFARFSNLNVRAALSLKATDTFYVGLEGSHQRAYTGIFFKEELGHAWFAGPTFFWQATDKLAVTGSYNYQFAGTTRDAVNVIGASSKGVDLINFNRHLVKLKVAYSF
jgi:hypothetical protein